MAENEQLPLDVNLRDDATFANYLGTAAVAIRNSNPWQYVWGIPGSGRSHLLQAMCHEHASAIFIDRLKQHEPTVLQGLEMVDVICIDDVDEVLGNTLWEEALFHLLNVVKDLGKQVIIAGPKPAAQLVINLADLKSRLIAANSIQTDELDDEQKLKVLMDRAHQRGFKLSASVGKYIMLRSPRDMRQLLNCLDVLEHQTLAQGKTVTIPFVKSTLGL